MGGEPGRDDFFHAFVIPRHLERPRALKTLVFFYVEMRDTYLIHNNDCYTDVFYYIAMFVYEPEASFKLCFANVISLLTN